MPRGARGALGGGLRGVQAPAAVTTLEPPATASRRPLWDGTHALTLPSLGLPRAPKRRACPVPRRQSPARGHSEPPGPQTRRSDGVSGPRTQKGPETETRWEPLFCRDTQGAAGVESRLYKFPRGASLTPAGRRVVSEVRTATGARERIDPVARPTPPRRPQRRGGLEASGKVGESGGFWGSRGLGGIWGLGSLGGWGVWGVGGSGGLGGRGNEGPRGSGQDVRGTPTRRNYLRRRPKVGFKFTVSKVTFISGVELSHSYKTFVITPVDPFSVNTEEKSPCHKRTPR